MCTNIYLNINIYIYIYTSSIYIYLRSPSYWRYKPTERYPWGTTMCYLGYPWIAWCKDISPWNDVNEGVRRRVSSADGETKIESPNASRMFQLDMARREPQFCSSFDEPFWNNFFSGYTFLTHTARKNALFCRQKVHIFDLKTMKAATTRYSGTQWNAVERRGTVGYRVLKSIRHPLYRMVPPSDVNVGL